MAIPLNLSANGRAILLALVVPLCVIATFLGGWWVARRAGGLLLLHGLLVGAVAALIYGGLTWKVSLPTAYIVANYLKLIGGAGGGVMAQSLLRNKPAPNESGSTENLLDPMARYGQLPSVRVPNCLLRSGRSQQLDRLWAVTTASGQTSILPMLTQRGRIQGRASGNTQSRITDCIESRLVMPIGARYSAVTSTLTGKERKSVACKLLQTSRVLNHMETNARAGFI